MQKLANKLKCIFYEVLIFFVITTVGSVILYKYLPVYVTPLMIIKSIQQISQGKRPTCTHTWVSFQSIAPDLSDAVIASEDNRFLLHHGFEWKEIQKAIQEYKMGEKMRGASTISQQTARNVFLWPSQSWIRKGFEAYYTCLIEFFWSKQRIMEVYLNSIEMGKNIYGAEAVAHKHFHTTAKKLSRSQCALIAATLPNPIRFNSANPSNYMLRRQKQILHNMKNLPIFQPKKNSSEK